MSIKGIIEAARKSLDVVRLERGHLQVEVFDAQKAAADLGDLAALLATEGTRALAAALNNASAVELARALEASTLRGPCERAATNKAGKVIMMRCFDRAHERAKRTQVRRAMRDWDLDGWGFCDSCIAHFYAIMASQAVERVSRIQRAQAASKLEDAPPEVRVIFDQARAAHDKVAGVNDVLHSAPSVGEEE